MAKGFSWARAPKEVYTRDRAELELGQSKWRALAEDEATERRRRWHTKAAREASFTRCYWCCGKYEKSGPYARSREHCVPLSKGGKDNGWNLAYAHILCNSRRGNDETWMPWHIHRRTGEMVRGK